MQISLDEALLEDIASRFDLRSPNKRALRRVVEHLSVSTEGIAELIADLATGVGKTFLMAALVDYLASQGVRNVLVVTPGSVIQRKTLANFDEASLKYVAGADHKSVVITPENFATASTSAALRDDDVLKVFVFNVHQLIQPGKEIKRKVRDLNENLGEALIGYLQNAADLFVIADEHHMYHEKARAFSAGIKDLNAVAVIGLTATPDPADASKVIFQYSLGEAIADGLVKIPVVVYRKGGTRDEPTQLADACHLLRVKERAYRDFQAMPTQQTEPHPVVHPVLFVVCQSIEHAEEVAQILAQPGFIGDPNAVLQITSQSSDEALMALSEVESPNSPIRAIVSVNMLREGWDVANIAVIAALRRLASQSLTEQILGRGLRLPFGVRTGSMPVDQVDLVAHDSYKQLLEQKDVLRQRIETPPAADEVDEHGAATTAGDVPTPDPTVPLAAPPAVEAASEAPDDAAPTNVTVAPVTFRPASGDEEGEQALFFVDTEDRLAGNLPKPMGRVADAPKIVFPRRESRLTHSAFSLSDIPDGDAQAAGARFIVEVPTFLTRDALVASREGDDVTIKVAPQKSEEAQQALAGLDVVREQLAAAIHAQPEVVQDSSSKNAARRLVRAFLKGAGVTTETETAEWGDNRRSQAVNGMRDLIKSSYSTRKQEVRYELVAVTLPIEPVMVNADAMDAYNDKFVKHAQFVGWQQNIMPVAAFDAGTTEWELAHLLDRDPAIEWWLRVYVNGPAFIPTTGGNYYPDFIALDKSGGFWLIEGKANKHAQDADVQAKKSAAEHWARSVRDSDEYGVWRYVFATEAAIASAKGSWNGLLSATNPE